MAADQERADRIRETWQRLKAEDPKRYTWRRIAAHVNDVSERAAQDWQKTGGIDYDNAKKLAEYFEVDFDWLWRGPKEAETPDPFAREDQVEGGFEEFRQHVGAIRKDIAEFRAEARSLLEEARTERHHIEALLQTQESILQEMRRVAGQFPSDETVRLFTEEVRRLEEAAEASAEQRDAAAADQA